MPQLPVILTTLFVIAALSALCVFALRLQRARKAFAQEVAAWRLGPEPSLQQARRERDQLLDALTDAFLLLDSESRVLFANRAAIAMFPERDLIGRSIDEAFCEPLLSEAFSHAQDADSPSATRVFLPHSIAPSGALEPHGGQALILDAARIAENPVGDLSTSIVIRDVTGEHQAEQMRKDFVANASHELRTPLAIISGYLENLLDDNLIDDPELARHFLKIMRKHTQRIVRIVEDMLVISRLESGEAIALQIKPFRIRKCFGDVVERLESVIQAQGANILFDMPDDTLKLVGDRFYWTQVIFNLVENALKQNRCGGLTITLGCARHEGNTRLWISDNGIGIPADDIPHIFRRFYRVEKHHSREEIEGTGLGLSIVKRAIEAHNGRIEVTSLPNEDTRFTITIPKFAQNHFKRRFKASQRAKQEAVSSY